MTHREDLTPIIVAPEAIHISPSTRAPLISKALPNLKKILTISTGGILLSAAADGQAQILNYCQANEEGTQVECSNQQVLNERSQENVAAINVPEPSLSHDTNPTFSARYNPPPNVAINAINPPTVELTPAIAWAETASGRPAAYALGQEADMIALQAGSEGDAVRTLQELLNTIGFEVKVTGTFDDDTQNAVQQFQAGRGLDADGVVDGTTRTSLVAAERVASTTGESYDQVILVGQSPGDFDDGELKVEEDADATDATADMESQDSEADGSLNGESEDETSTETLPDSEDAAESDDTEATEGSLTEDESNESEDTPVDDDAPTDAETSEDATTETESTETEDSANGQTTDDTEEMPLETTDEDESTTNEAESADSPSDEDSTEAGATDEPTTDDAEAEAAEDESATEEDEDAAPAAEDSSETEESASDAVTNDDPEKAPAATTDDGESTVDETQPSATTADEKPKDGPHEPSVRTEDAPATTSSPPSTTGDSPVPTTSNDTADHDVTPTTPQTPTASKAPAEPGGTINNTATSTSRETQPQGASADVPVASNPVFGFNKTVTEVINPDGNIDSDKVVDEAGDVIKYNMRVSNFGNVTLNGVTITDSLLADNPAENVTLQVGEELFFQGEYTVTQADIDGDSSYIFNEATFSSNRTSPQTDGEAVPIRKNPALKVDKQATSVDRKNDNTLNAVGDVAEYSIVVTNTGNQTLTNVQVNDLRIGNQSIDRLAPGQSKTFLGQYELTQQDIDSNGEGDGDIDNTVIVNADQIAPAQDFVELDLEQNPALEIDKRVLDVDKAGDGVLNNAGETVDYEVIVTNTGNQTLSNVIVTDPLLGGTIEEGFSLSPGASRSYQLTYTVTQSDLDNNGGPINTPEFLNPSQP